MIQETRAAAQMNEFDRAALKPGATNVFKWSPELESSLVSCATEFRYYYCARRRMFAWVWNDSGELCAVALEVA